MLIRILTTWYDPEDNSYLLKGTRQRNVLELESDGRPDSNSLAKLATRLRKELGGITCYLDDNDTLHVIIEREDDFHNDHYMMTLVRFITKTYVEIRYPNAPHYLD